MHNRCNLRQTVQLWIVSILCNFCIEIFNAVLLELIMILNLTWKGWLLADSVVCYRWNQGKPNAKMQIVFWYYWSLNCAYKDMQTKIMNSFVCRTLICILSIIFVESTFHFGIFWIQQYIHFSSGNCLLLLIAKFRNDMAVCTQSSNLGNTLMNRI